jgi:hypothetical protein
MANLLELSEITDANQIETIESFFEAIFPNIGFIELNPGRIITQERRLLRGERIDPACDTRLLQHFVDFLRDGVDPLSQVDL